jgi:predicted ATPase
MKGKVLSHLPEPRIEEAENCLMQALELSRAEGAKAWELRAATDLAQLLADRRRYEEARLLLRSALAGFVAGSETADIRAADALLKTL